MKQLSIAEQVRKDLLDLSPDFVKEQKKIQHIMIHHKPTITQNPHFKQQLAQRIERHIAWSQTPNKGKIFSFSNSRLARLVAYGMPWLAMCFVVLYLAPWSPLHRQELTPTSAPQKDIESSITNDTVANDHKLWLDNNDNLISGQEIPTTAKVSTTIDVSLHIPIEKQTAIENDIAPMLYRTSDENIQTDSIVQWVGTKETQRETIPQQTDSPSTTYNSRYAVGQQLSQYLGITVVTTEWSLVDCVQQSSRTYLCQVLADREVNKDHITLLINELQRHTPDTIHSDQRDDITKKLYDTFLL